MPIGFLTAADRARLNRFPEQIPHEDLSAFFLLSKADQRAISQQHSEAHTRLGFALQLCALRYLGFAPDDVTTAPALARVRGRHCAGRETAPARAWCR
jgi:hypothetical protein